MWYALWLYLYNNIWNMCVDMHGCPCVVFGYICITIFELCLYTCMDFCMHAWMFVYVRWCIVCIHAWMVSIHVWWWFCFLWRSLRFSSVCIHACMIFYVYVHYDTRRCVCIRNACVCTWHMHACVHAMYVIYVIMCVCMCVCGVGLMYIHLLCI